MDATAGRLEHVMAILGGDVLADVANDTHFAANSHFLGRLSRALVELRGILDAGS